MVLEKNSVDLCRYLPLIIIYLLEICFSCSNIIWLSDISIYTWGCHLYYYYDNHSVRLIFDRIMIQPASVWRLWSQPHTPHQCNSKRTRIVHPVVDQRCRLWANIIPSTGLPSLFAIYMYYNACCTAYVIVTLEALKSEIKIFTHLKLCLFTAIHNFKFVKIVYICIKMYANFANWCIQIHFAGTDYILFVFFTFLIIILHISF